MPVLEIRALPQPDPGRVGAALAATCLAIAREYGCEPHHVWATWVTLKPGHYVEGDRPATEQPGQTHPPIGRLLCFEGRDPETIERVLIAAAETLSRELGMPGNIFIEYVEARSGRVFDGGGVIRR